MAGGGSNSNNSKALGSGLGKSVTKGGKYAADKALRLATNKRGFKPYGGDWFVGPSDQTQAALGGMEDIASQGNPLAQQGMDLSSDLMGGLLGASNPAFESVVDTQIGKLGDDITRQFGGAAFGGADHSGVLAEQLGDARDRMVSNNWFQNQQADVQNRLAGFGIANPAYQAQYAPYERMSQIGSALEGYDAAELQGLMGKHDAKQMAPWARLGAMTDVLQGGGGLLNAATLAQQAQAQMPQSNRFGGALGGALLGGQALGPYGALGGGLLGFLGG